MFVYSSGKLVAEYSNQVSQTPTVAYTTTDHLGSPRIITNQFGNVVSRRDFMPFGEDIFENIGAARTAALNYSSNQDDIRQKFTGYQKDSETGLDFAEARMYENRFGRFTAVDPLLASGRSADPQTFNRYTYTSNNPVVRVDVNGKDWYYFRELKIDRSGRSFYHRTIYWDEDNVNLAGRDRYQGAGVIRETAGQNRGRWTALDPFEGRSATFKSRAEAAAQYQSYLRDAKINGSRGFADAIAGLATGNPLTALLYEWGADAIIGRPDPDSNLYTVTNRATNAMIIVGSATAGPAVAALRGGQAGSLASEASTLVATGQRHHLITNKIMRALGRHDNLKGVFNRQDARFIYNAADEAAHRGYQKWHRRYDDEVTTWLERNREATEEQFLKYLNDLHQQEWLRKHIPNVNL